MDVIKQIEIHYVHLTSSEKKVAITIMKHLSDLIELTIKDFSEKYELSTGSIVRMSKKIGYDGYSDLVYSAKKNRKKENISQDTKLNQKIISRYQLALGDLKDENIHDNLMKLGTKLRNCDEIISVGIGNSSLPAKQLKFSMYENLRTTLVLENESEIKLSKETIKKKKDNIVIIIFSVSGYSQLYEDVFSDIVGENITKIMITMNSKIKNSKDYDYIFNLVSAGYTIPNNSEEPIFFDSRSIMFLFADLITFYYKIGLEK